MAESITADIVLPQFGVDACLGATIALLWPSPTLDANGGAEAVFSLPALTLDAVAHDSTGENALDITLPALTAAANCGASVEVELPMFALDASMTSTALIEVDAALPMLTLDAHGVGSPYIIKADIDLPIFTVDGYFGTEVDSDLPMITVDASLTVGGVLSCAIDLPMLAIEAYFGVSLDVDMPSMTLDASMTAGSVLTVDISLPMFTLDAAGTRQNSGSIDITLPMLIPSIFATADFSLPMLSLDAQITAVVTVSYEAYAVNLKHSPRSGDNMQPIDEMTHYTNFPFTQIVRYKNSYYGVAEDGLYLLEGATDNGAPIPWSIKTGTTDFGTPTQKTVAAAYFSGRMGAASTVTHTAGEGTGINYNFTTPLGTPAKNYRQVLAKGVKARYHALGASGTGVCELDGIEFDVRQLSRRI